MVEVEIEALKPFNKTPQGDLCEVGDVFPVSATRAEELERLGLAKPADADNTKVEPEAKAAPQPANKARPAPANKSKG